MSRFKCFNCGRRFFFYNASSQPDRIPSNPRFHPSVYIHSATFVLHLLWLCLHCLAKDVQFWVCQKGDVWSFVLDVSADLFFFPPYIELSLHHQMYLVCLFCSQCHNKVCESWRQGDMFIYSVFQKLTHVLGHVHCLQQITALQKAPRLDSLGCWLSKVSLKETHSPKFSSVGLAQTRGWLDLNLSEPTYEWACQPINLHF